MSWQSMTCKNMQQFNFIYEAAKHFVSQDVAFDVQIREAQTSRKAAQNALQFHWFKEMEMQGDMTANEYRAKCKLHYGVPIARENPEFDKVYRQVIIRQDYETKFAMMLEPIDLPVTRSFLVKDMARYLTAIEQGEAKNGMTLTTGHDLYLKAIGAIA